MAVSEFEMQAPLKFLVDDEGSIFLVADLPGALAQDQKPRRVCLGQVKDDTVQINLPGGKFVVCRIVR